MSDPLSGSLFDGDDEEPRICILLRPAPLADEVADLIFGHGFSVSVCDGLPSLKQISGKSNRTVVVTWLEDDGAEKTISGLDVIRALNAERDTPVPFLVISKREDFDARLKAVRNAASDFLPHPIDIPELVEKLDRIVNPEPPAPFRVLLVDDDPIVARVHARILHGAGMLTRIETDPTLVTGLMSEWLPDLLLLDLHMPGCSGMELAQIVRQLPTFDGIPIVFLSSEKEQSRQLAAISVGGDDFLIKPIHPNRLIASVVARAQRMRLLRQQMTQDPMTKLLNHSAIKNHLQNEMARLERRPGKVTFALVDIDRFKTINDSFGHPVGDIVIKTLSRLLKRRLRNSDGVGRYGGEEFAVVMPDTSVGEATEILDEIRHRFEGIVHNTVSGQTFSATFSGGLTEAEHGQATEDIIHRADQALYGAKSLGRNRITTG